jgi:Pectate lyase superfamily protein
MMITILQERATKAWRVTVPILAACVVAMPVMAASKVDVRERGATGDGQTLDTQSIQKALDDCAASGGGQVFFPPGKYVSGTIHLRSSVTIYLDAGARLLGTTNLALYSQPKTPDYMPEARWGKWHRGLVVGENVDDVAIVGPGMIDGNKVFDPSGEERMRGPHGIVLVNCHRFELRDLTLVDAANYAVFFQASDDVELRNVKIVGGWDGVHWRGAPEHWCRNVKIIGCQFYTGDDAIAGRYWDDTTIQDCLINSSCNGIRLIGPATHLTIANNLFRGPGEQPHRTSGPKHRTNMLSGIILQPGAWDQTRGPLDDVLVANNVMENVASPVTLWNKPGNTVGRVTISGLHATGVYQSAISAESWSDTPITNLILRGVQMEFAGGRGAWPAGQTVQSPGFDARPLPSWGFYGRNIQILAIEDSRFSLASDDRRPVISAEKVERMSLSGVRYPDISGVAAAVVTTNVVKFTQTP